MRRYHILFSICFSLCLFSCYDDFELQDETIIIQEEDIFYDGGIAGQVVDGLGQPMVDVVIEYASNFQTSSQKGLFYLDGERIRHQGELLTIRDASQFEYFHTAFPSQNDIHYTTSNCQLNRELIFSSTSNFNASLEQGGQLTAGNVEFLKANDTYVGDVVLEGYYLDLQEEDNLNLFPMAATSNTLVTHLNKICGIHFQWNASDGERLTLADNQSVSVSLPTTSTSTDVYVWYFNSATAEWDQQAKPTLSGGEYTFSIKSDGYYCIAEAMDAAHVDGYVLTNGKVVPNTRILIRNRAGKLIQESRTSSSGAFHAIVPSHENHVVQVMDICGENIWSDEFDPNADASSSMDLNIDGLPSFIGASKSCDNELVSNSFLLVNDEHFVFLYDGQLDAGLPICGGNELNLSAYDSDSEQESSKLLWPPEQSNHIQSLFICEQPKNNYIALRADGVMRYYEVTESRIDSDGRLEVSAIDASDPSFHFDIKLPFETTGSLATEELNVRFFDNELGLDGYATSCFDVNATCGFESFELNHRGSEAEDWICAEFVATFWMQTTNLNPNRAYNNRTIEGEFRIKRNF